MRVRQGGSETRFIRDGDSWSAEGMDGASAAREATRILDLLTATAAAKVVVAEYPRDREAGLFVLEGFDGRPLDTVRMAQLESGEIALENGDGVLRVLSAGAAGRR